MSISSLVIEERSRKLGDFLVGRILPFRKKRAVGPFVFIDHMGPSEIKPHQYLDIDPHPHIGLSTLTYLFEGVIEHRDSLGMIQNILPGEVNFMTAGKGVTHTERTPESQRNGQTYRMHGFQIWVAMPAALETGNPEFQHLEASDIPEWHAQGAAFRLIAGAAFGHRSPLKVYSPLYLIELKTTKDFTLSTAELGTGEHGLSIINGGVTLSDEIIPAGNTLVAMSTETCALTIHANSHVMLFGGEPFPEERRMYWNFVSSRQELIDDAILRWKNHDFPQVPGDDGYIPLPA